MYFFNSGAHWTTSNHLPSSMTLSDCEPVYITTAASHPSLVHSKVSSNHPAVASTRASVNAEH
jgi:hypothetical protein